MPEFVVRVPHETPAEPLFLAGDGDRFGHWRAAGVPLERGGDGTFRARLDLPDGEPHRFLVTRGHWRRAENDGTGRERSPRRIVPHGPGTLEVAVAGWGRTSVRYHHGFGSRFVTHPRTLAVYLPPGYDLEPARRFPVLYLHDGQNLFDAFTAFAGVPWGADETTERAVRSGGVRPVVIVGVANSPDRLHEYGPQPGPDDRSRDYARFLVEEVKPFVDATYRTLPDAADTGVGGSSMGGLISLHLCRWRPDVFGRCAAMSPSLWWDDAAYLRSFGGETDWLRRCRIWLDMGGREGATEASRRGNVRRARALARMLRRAGADFHYHEDPHGGHDEAAWGWRFDPMLRFLLPPPPDRGYSLPASL
jgi:predicted alpha/beta superfamily hydrolase